MRQVVHTGEIPPTLNCDEPDLEDGCDLDYTPHTSVKLDKVRETHADRQCRYVVS